MPLNLGTSPTDKDKYDACPKHTKDECRKRTSDINCTHYGQIKTTSKKYIIQTSTGKGDVTVNSKTLLKMYTLKNGY